MFDLGAGGLVACCQPVGEGEEGCEAVDDFVLFGEKSRCRNGAILLYWHLNKPPMNKQEDKREKNERNGMKDHYDFDSSKAKPNRFATRLVEDHLMVVLDPEIAQIFPTSEAVNNALRVLAAASKSAQRLAVSGDSLPLSHNKTPIDNKNLLPYTR